MIGVFPVLYRPTVHHAPEVSLSCWDVIVCVAALFGLAFLLFVAVVLFVRFIDRW